MEILNLNYFVLNRFIATLKKEKISLAITGKKYISFPSGIDFSIILIKRKSVFMQSVSVINLL